MAIGSRGTASASELDGANTTVTLPAGTVTGDLVVMVVGGESADGNEAMAMTTTGYTLQAEGFANDNRDSNLGVFTKVMGGTPDTTAVATGFGNATSVQVAAAYVATGVDTTTPIDVATPAPTSALNGGNADSPSITTVTNGCQILSVFANTRSADIPTEPSGYSSVITDSNTDGTNRSRVAIAYRDQTTAGAEDPGAWSNMTGGTNDSWAAATLALRPASGGGGDTITPSAIEAVGAVVNPTVQLGSLVIGPVAAAAVGAIVGPSIVLGSVTVTPTDVSAVGTVVNPTVITPNGVLVEPTPIDAVGAVVDPTVQLGSTTAAPSAAAAVGAVANPTVLVPGTGDTVVPDAAEARTDTVIEQILIGNGRKFAPEAPLSGVWTPDAPHFATPWL